MSDRLLPVLCRWLNGAFVPVRKPPTGMYVEGEYYRLEPREERSGKQHRWFFVSVNEAWKSLPEDIAERFPNADYLRRWALVKAGYCTESTLVLTSADQAHDVAKAARKLDSYAVIAVKENVVQIFTAKSQSVRSMNKDEFKESADKVLDIIADLTGNTRTELKSARESA